MSTAQRVIDDIHALVDEQLTAGEAPGGYDYNDPEFPRCRCGCMWHGLRRGVCPGSDTEGPLMATGLSFGNWASEPPLPPRRLGHFDPTDSIAAAQRWLESNFLPLGGIAPRGVRVGGRGFGRPNLERIFLLGRSGLVYEMFAEAPDSLHLGRSAPHAFRPVAGAAPGCQEGTSSTAPGGEVRPSPGGARRPCGPHADP